MKKILLLMCAAFVAMVSCTKIDNLESKVDDIDARVKTLEEKVEAMNNQITALDALVQTIKNGGYITDVTSEVKNGLNYYTLTLSNGKTYTIHDGAKGADGADGANGKDGVDGKDGHTPVIGVKLDEDGNYYWTVDGAYTDPKVKANGEDGQTPKIEILSGYLVITWPGQTPQYYEVKGENGKDGDSFFQKVDVTEDEVVFTLADGTTFNVSLLGNFRLSCPSTTVGVAPSSVATIKYEVKGVKADEEVVVYVKYVSEGWTATVDEAACELKINVPANPKGGLVIIEAINNTTSQVADQAIRFEDGVLTSTDTSFSLSDASHTFEVAVSTNMNYEVAIDVDWIKLVEVKAPHTETLTFTADLNTDAADRNGKITITGATGEVIEVVVLQKGCPALKESYEIGEFYERQGVVGVVFHCDENVVKVLALDDKKFINFADYATANSWADSKTDGFANQKKILDNQYSDITWFPAHNWCYSKGAGWYLPAEEEMAEILDNIDVLNTAINAHDGNSLIKGFYYWSSTQNTSTREAVTVCWDWDYGKAVSTPKDPTIASYTARAAFNVKLKEEDPDTPVETSLAIGDEMTIDNGTGVIAYIDETGKSGFIVNLEQSDMIHFASGSQSYDAWPKSETDYQANYEIISGSDLPCLAQSWAGNCGTAGWRVPAKEQMKQIMSNLSAINKGIEAAGGTQIMEYKYYWTSTTYFSDDSGTNAYIIAACDGEVLSSSDEIQYGNLYYTRAIHAFTIE